MKVKMLSRNPANYRRQTTDDVFKVPRNSDPGEHPFAAEREYVRALQATKVERLLAKPFIGCLDGTTDVVTVMTLDPNALARGIFGTADGQLQFWNLSSRKMLKKTVAHEGQVRGVSYYQENLFTCGADGYLKSWTLTDWASGWAETPTDSVLLQWTPHCMDLSPPASMLCVGGMESLLLYSMSKLDSPVREWAWGREAVHCAKFNPIETNVLAALSRDNAVNLFDIRQDVPLKKVEMRLRLNSLSWNPMEAYTFVAGCEDYNLYTFDLRSMKYPRRVHRGHVNAVMDVDYSPTGREFVSGSYDHTVRLWLAEGSESRDVYHARRMKRVFGVRFTLDAKYLLSASSDQNVRLWKAKASAKLEPLNHRQKAAMAEAESLKAKYENHPEIRRIAKNRHLPKFIYAATKEQRTMRSKERRKERNVKVNSRPGTVEFVKERERHTVAERD